MKRTFKISEIATDVPLEIGSKISHAGRNWTVIAIFKEKDIVQLED